MSNQDPKADKGKLRLTLVPLQIIREIAKVRMFGVAKYPKTGVDGWKSIEIERIRDAAFRHFIAYLEDPAGLDEESGLPHLSHLACNISFLCEMELAEHKADAKEPDKSDWVFYSQEEIEKGLMKMKREMKLRKEVKDV